MAVPSKNFTVIPDGSIDADSPITQDLMTDFRDNDINLEEWLGKNYTAAVDHDHDGANSAPVNISAVLAAYNAQHSVDANSSWSISTGALGFTPQAMVVHWGVEFGSLNEIHYGWGLAMGTGAGNQSGFATRFDSSGPAFDGSAIDASNVMGTTANTAGGLNTTFAEKGEVTAWAAGGITIATTTGVWRGSAGTLYVNIQIWGA